MKSIKSANAPAPIGPYSQAILANGFLYVSGQIPLIPETGEMVTTGVGDEAKQVMKNLEAVLTEAGTDFSRVVKTTIFLKDMNDFATVNSVYAPHFSEPFPARETVEVARLPKDANVEIAFIALVG